MSIYLNTNQLSQTQGASSKNEGKKNSKIKEFGKKLIHKKEKQRTIKKAWNQVVTSLKGVGALGKGTRIGLEFWLEKLDKHHRPWFLKETPQCLLQDPFHWKSVSYASIVEEWKQSSFVDFFEFLEKVHPEIKPEGVKYLETPEERAPFLTTIEKGIFYKNGQPFSTAPSALSPIQLHEIFVLSPNQELYIGPFIKGYFHHSSFLAGGPVAFAGELLIENGVLKAISNRSGHYRPQEVEAFLKYLKSHGVQLEGVELELLDDQGNVAYEGDAGEYFERLEQIERGKQIQKAFQESGKGGIKQLLTTMDIDDPFIVDNCKQNFIHWICRKNLGPEWFEWILSLNPTLYAEDERSCCPLSILLGKEPTPLKEIEILLKNGANLSFSTWNEDAGYYLSPLHCAVLQQNPALLKLLLAYGVDVNSKDEEGNTALHWALKQNPIHEEIIDILLEAGADPNCQNDVTKQTPMQVLLFKLESAPKMVQKFLAKGGNLLAVNSTNGATLLHLIAFKGRMDLLPVFLSAGKEHLNIRDGNQNTALHYFAQSKNPSSYVAKLLIENGADPNLLNQKGFAPLHTAVLAQNKEAICALIEAGVNIDLPSGVKGATALDLALIQKLPIAQFLIEKGAKTRIIKQN